MRISFFRFLLVAVAALQLGVSPAAASSKYGPTSGGGGAVSSVSAGTGCVTVSPTTGAVIVTSTGCLTASNNLSDLASASTSRTNLGLGTAATQSTGTFAQVANNLSDLANVGTARTNLGLGTAATQATGVFAQVANNLSDLASASTARTNLGLGTAATQSTGTFAQVANNLSDLANVGTARTNLGLGTLATQSGTFSGTSSGTNTGDQTITLTGPVTGSGTGSFATTITAGAVTLANHANMTTARIVGRTTAGSGAPEELTAAQTQGILFGSLSSGPAFVTTTTGAVTALTTLTGLTSTSSALTVNLSTGVSGGQTLIGGTASGDSITYSSTSNGTKGSHIFGTTSGMTYDEANVLLRVGTATTFSGQVATMVKTVAGQLNLWVANTNTGTTSQACVQVGQSAAGTGAGLAQCMNSSGYTTSGVYSANAGLLEMTGGSNLILSVRQSSGDLIVATTSSKTERFRVTNAGNIVHGPAALATNATDGHMYIPTTAGTPTGVPTSFTGQAAMLYDTTNHKLYIYDGGWKGGTVPGAWN